MKFIALLILAFPTLALAGNFLTFQEYQKLNPKQKIEMLKAYKEFVKEVLKNEKDIEALTFSARFSFIYDAYAAGKYDCFYAGWPSIKKTVTTQGNTKTFCSSPAKSNLAYQALAQSCGAGQMLCQPVLFGAGLCIDVKTQVQRNSAFSQCQQKSGAAGNTIEKLAKELDKPELAPLADEMFALVHDICEGNGFQSKTGMCTGLKKKVAAVKENKPVGEKLTSNNKSEKIQLIDQGKIVEDEKLKEKIIKTVDKINESENISVMVNRKVTCDKCEQLKNQQNLDEVLAPHEASEPIDQSKKTEKDFCAGGQKGTEKKKYSQGIHSDSDNDVSINILYQQNGEDQKNRVVGGYDVDAGRMGTGFPYVEEGVELTGEDAQTMYPKRTYSDTYEGRGKQSVFEIVDMPVREDYENKKVKERYISTDMRITQLTFFPRKNVPSIKKRDDKIIMKLTTGEEVIVDAITGRVVGGVAQSISAKNPVEIRPTNKRMYPDNDFSYQGEGLFIESKVTYNKDERKPGSIVPVKALVDGKWQECKLKSDDLWAYDYGAYLPRGSEGYFSSEWTCTRFKIETDEEFYALIKKTCPTFKFPPLAK